MTLLNSSEGNALGPNTPVLLRRPLRPDAAPSALSIFGDDTWDLTPGIHEDHAIKYSINFSRFPAAFRADLKVYLWMLINSESVRPVQGGPADRTEIALSTIAQALTPLARFLAWCDEHEIASLQSVTETHLDELLADCLEAGLATPAIQKIITETRRLWANRSLVPEAIRLAERSPWNNEAAADILGLKPSASGNRTPRIADETILPLLSWALRFTQDFAGDIIDAYREYWELSSASWRYSEAGPRTPHIVGARQTRLLEALGRLRSLGLGLPGRIHPDTQVPQINWTHLGRLTGSYGLSHSTYDRELIEASGMPLDDDSYLLTECRGQIDGHLWNGRFVRWNDVVPLAQLLQTACFVVVSYLSGMRPGEVLTLRANCASQNPATGLWEVRGTRWKAAQDSSGAKIPTGRLDGNPWVVHPLASQAVDLLTELAEISGTELLFPASIRPARVRGAAERHNARAGTALTTARATTEISRFIDWISTYCDAHGRSDAIPADPDGRLTPRRFRRTLAWHIVRRPRGLVAAAIQYGHISTHITQGYSGTYASGFPGEIAMERWLQRIEQFAEMDRYLDSEGHISGPAANELRDRTSAANAKYAGRVLPTNRQASQMLSDPVLQIYQGDGLHCVFNRATALCARDVPEPVLGNCSPNCRNAARTDDDIDKLRATQQELVDDRLAPPIRYARGREVAERIQHFIDDHEHGSKR